MGGIKERPILFSGDMVKAILDGRKTQTRRVMNPQPIMPTFGAEIGEFGEYYAYNEWTCPQIEVLGLSWKEAKKHRRNIKCPYGKIGDRLWVRETFLYVGPGSGSDLPYAIEETKDPTNHIRENVWYRVTKPDDSLRWKSPIFMPRWASRILLEVTGVRVERVQEIKNWEIRAEGLPPYTTIGGSFQMPAVPVWITEQFRDLWDSINAKRGYSWQSNPFVWVVEFKRVEP